MSIDECNKFTIKGSQIALNDMSKMKKNANSVAG